MFLFTASAAAAGAVLPAAPAFPYNPAHYLRFANSSLWLLRDPSNALFLAD
jgi:hypothetical protein